MKKISFKAIAIFIAILSFTFHSYASPNNGNGNRNGNNGNNGGGTSNNHGQHNSNSGYTQTNGNSTNNNGNGSNKKRNNDSIPLDGGLSILLAGAAAFGVKKLRDSKKEKK
ncbi:PID-CTERM protein-sorting domain-containing protein [Mariniflexile sp.]|uniref:PID-CTERM protein-sorting domain-containing protein n=1 Tax=Mariniflexile sp. TaxID=1979402 RepID=UPI00356A5FB0